MPLGTVPPRPTCCMKYAVINSATENSGIDALAHAMPLHG